MSNYEYDAIVDVADSKRLFSAMDTELTFYNRIVEVFSPQFNRDYKVFLSMDDNTVKLFGDMCVTPTDITVKSEKLPESFEKHIPVIQCLSNMQKFVLSSAIRSIHYIADTKRRIGMSILQFYISQAEIREVNSYVNVEGETIFKVPSDTLSTYTNFNKKHVQISRNECVLEKDNGKTLIYTPFTKGPISINDESVYHKKWNYIIIKQKDKIRLTNGDWCVMLRNMKQNEYHYKMVDRLGKSSIVELTKSRK
jgi:hypothetical protein